MNKNTGGAGGFYEGVKRAYEKGYDWLWLMDDDVEPRNDALEELLKFRQISNCIHPIKKYVNNEIFAWNGYICDKYGVFVTKEENFKDKNFSCVNYGCFEGMLIHRSLISKIGYPKREFFLAGDDAYYGYMASEQTNVIYTNKAEFLKKIKKTKKSSSYIYYVNRNFTFFLLKISKRKIVTFIYRFIIAIYFTMKYGTFASLKGFVDGVRGKLGIYNDQ
jgi:GT2 family glycosyltransferase